MDILEMEIMSDDRQLDSNIDFTGEFIHNLLEKDIKEAINKYLLDNGLVYRTARIKEITLYANKWVGEGIRYSQNVYIDGIKSNDQVDIKLTDDQAEIFYDKKVTLTTVNNNGVVTVGLVGQKLEHDYTIQVTLTEVDYE